MTSAELGARLRKNVPAKSNFQGRTGMEAMTGKSNFDISEWMLLRYLEWLERRGGWIGVLVKTVVARKLMVQAWRRRYPFRRTAIYGIDAMLHFGAAVDACLFVAEIAPGAVARECAGFAAIGAAASPSAASAERPSMGSSSPPPSAPSNLRLPRLIAPAPAASPWPRPCRAPP